MRPERVWRIAAFLLAPEGCRLREPGARRLACDRACPGSTGDEIARDVTVAAETVAAAADRGAPGRPTRLDPIAE